MTFKVYLKANDRIFVNGAVLRVDRKTTLEFLNDVSFLLQSQILQPEQADTPLKQLYYVVQIMLMAPNDTEAAFSVYRAQLPAVMQAFSNPKIVSELKNVDRLVHEKSFHSAMKTIRELFKLEAAILEADSGHLVEKLNAAADLMRRSEASKQQQKSASA